MRELPRQAQYVLVFLIIGVIFGSGVQLGRWQGQLAGSRPLILEQEHIQKSEPTLVPEPEIKVHVAGAVVNPGVYCFQGDVRVEDALDKAIPTVEADLGALNLAAPLRDGQQIMVFKIGETVTGGGINPPSGVSGSGQININTAGLSELDHLPGIGPALAQRIIDYREQNGFFAAPEDLKDVPGIGDKKFADLKELITY